jgi:hypothetical protein
MFGSFVADATGSEFPIQNLPYGVFVLRAAPLDKPRVGPSRPRVYAILLNSTRRASRGGKLTSSKLWRIGCPE